MCDILQEIEIAEQLVVQNFSLQILSIGERDLTVFKRFKSLQVLMDESLDGKANGLLRKAGLEISDITPSISFISISLEFFANLRKAQVA